MSCEAQEQRQITLISTSTVAEEVDKHNNNANEAAKYKNDAK